MMADLSRPRHPRFQARSLALLLATLGSMPAAQSAPGDQGLDVNAGIGYFHDDNLFRLPDGHPGFAGQRSDSARHAHLGLVLDQTWGRQRVQAHGRLTRVEFHRFSQLDHDGRDADAKWHWQLGNRLDGTLGAAYTRALAPYTDFRSDQRNLRDHRRQFLDARWRLHPSWRARGGASRDKYSYDLALQRFNDRTEDAWEAGADYLPASGSTVGLVARRIRADYLSPRSLGGQALDESFRQDELKARINWIASGSTTLQILAGHARRSYRQRAGRDDASGFNGRLTVQHEPVGKLRYTAAAWREFSAVESNVVSYSLNRGASAAVAWEASAKVRIDASASHERRGYRERIAAALPRDLDDSLSRAALSATWSPRRTLAISAAIKREERSGSPFLGLGRFKANTVSLAARAQF